MREWTHKIEITLPSDPRRASNELADRLRRLPAPFRALGRLDTLDDMIDWLGDEPVDFDHDLHCIYDWADRHGLWLLITYATEPAQ